MNVSSLDGIIGWQENDSQSGAEIAMSHIPNSGSESDWRLLNGGWMMADAVLGTGEILRNEPDIKWTPKFDDMINERISEKKSKYPINVVLSGSGNLPTNHPMFQDKELKVIIFTSENGAKKLNYFKENPDLNNEIEVISPKEKKK